MFGPPGAGKGTQAQLLAKKHSWRWLSTGQLLRDSDDPRIHAIMKSGALVSDDDMNIVVGNALAGIPSGVDVIMDGYPRIPEQAKWLIKKNKELGRRIDTVISLVVSDEETFKRLNGRGRADDTPETMNVRSKLYHQKTEPLLSLFEREGIAVVRVNGEGSVEEIYERVDRAVQSCLQK